MIKYQLKKEYLDMIELLEQADEETKLCWLKDGYELDDGSHCFKFENKQDLIDALKNDVNKVRG